ncbi:MAG: efflux RND transporter periplasmic adaptor subunit [Deltaproteobacteria bacterium]|jgi:Cu(I)/Ag(I) efflux system membrane fusion protein/cobalt-zinc-cadmium efflux system membrane fusion protein|nr:efflux RND transporter periplasmic adaptor subunit [Deltaproteobacteria bacterium]
MNAKQTFGIAIALALALAVGWFGKGLQAPPGAPDQHTDMPSGAVDGPCPDGSQPLHWVAPMDPNFIRDEPGKSPMGMDLVPKCASTSIEKSEGQVKIDPTVVQNIGVRTERVERRVLERIIRSAGRVDYDERLVAHVHTKVQGWVEKLYVDYEGQRVERGQPLLEIYSPELVSTQEEILIAVRYREETKDSPFVDVRHGGASLLDAAKQRLALWDVPERDIQRLIETGETRKTLTLYAPSRGAVTHLMVREGMEVAPNSNLYTIADLSRVWVYANVYEYELPWVELGQRAIVEISYLPGQSFEGTVTHIDPFLDPATRTARVRLEHANPDGLLKPEMFANVSIIADAQDDALAIPEEALIRSGRRNLVFVALGEGRFEPRVVEVGSRTGDGWIEIGGGLAEGEVIVSSGQFLIDSESRLQESLQKFLSHREEEPPAHHHHEMMDMGS